MTHKTNLQNEENCVVVGGGGGCVIRLLGLWSCVKKLLWKGRDLYVVFRDCAALHV